MHSYYSYKGAYHLNQAWILIDNINIAFADICSMSALPLKQAVNRVFDAAHARLKVCRYGCEACHCQGIESAVPVVGPQLEMRRSRQTWVLNQNWGSLQILQLREAFDCVWLLNGQLRSVQSRSWSTSWVAGERCCHRWACTCASGGGCPSRILP